MRRLDDKGLNIKGREIKQAHWLKHSEDSIWNVGEMEVRIFWVDITIVIMGGTGMK